MRTHVVSRRAATSHGQADAARVPNPYDEFPYRSLPIEWTAPERLAVASLLHGGPRVPLQCYRVLELGCGDGANLLPMALFRPHGEFVGVDGARSQIALAVGRHKAMALSNISFTQADFDTANEQLDGKFEFILAHGVFSWITVAERDSLLQLFSQRLAPGGLLYLNYNAKPGWHLRGMVRDFLMAQTAGPRSLRVRTADAQQVAAKLAGTLELEEHPYSRLLANEFRFVCESHPSYVAHEFLASENHSFWRSELLALMQSAGLEYVADADFNYVSGRSVERLDAKLAAEGIVGRNAGDTADLLRYRQLHSPIFARGPKSRVPPSAEEFANLFVASSLVPAMANEAGNPMLDHPNGCRVEVKDGAIWCALTKLQRLWPRGVKVGSIFDEVAQVMEDLELLHRNGMIELRSDEPPDSLRSYVVPPAVEGDTYGYQVTPYHSILIDVVGTTSQSPTCLMREEPRLVGG